MANKEKYVDISQVWHDPSEKPVAGRMILVLFKSGNLTSWRSTLDITAAFEKHSAVKWAYVEDLLPEDLK